MDKYLIKSDCKKPVLYLRIEPEVYNNEISGRQGEPVRISRFGGNRSQSSHHYTRKPSVAVESALFSGESFFLNGICHLTQDIWKWAI